MELSEKGRYLVAFFLVLIGLTLHPIFIRERLPSSKDQLRAMTRGDWLVLGTLSSAWLYVVLLAFTALSAGNLTDDPKVSLCQGVLLSSFMVQACLQTLRTVIHVERMRDITQPLHRPRCKDLRYLSHLAILILPAIPCMVLLLVESRTKSHNGRCYLDISIVISVTTLVYLVLACIFLTYMSCKPLIKSRDRNMRMWAYRLIAGAFLVTITCGGTAAFVIIRRERSMFDWLMLMLVDTIMASIAIHYLFAWRPAYKRIINLNSNVPPMADETIEHKQNDHQSFSYFSQKAPTYRLHKIDEGFQAELSAAMITSPRRSVLDQTLAHKSHQIATRDEITAYVTANAPSFRTSDSRLVEKEEAQDVANVREIKLKPVSTTPQEQEASFSKVLEALGQVRRGSDLTVPSQYTDFDTARASLYACETEHSSTAGSPQPEPKESETNSTTPTDSGLGGSPASIDRMFGHTWSPGIEP